MKNRLLNKAMALAVVTAVLLVALLAVREVVDERRGRQAAAEESVAASLAGEQTLLGPVLARRCRETWTRVEGEGDQRRRWIEHADTTRTSWPKRLSVRTSVRIEPRYRGLFEVNGFAAESTVAADWDGVVSPTPRTDAADARIACDAPTIAFALSDARGIRATRVVVAGVERPALPGSGLAAAAQGFHADVAEVETKTPLHVDLALTIAGTRGLAWTPVADQSTVAVSSDWPHPSFAGRFLPVARTVRANGFEATWAVSALATTAQQAIAGDAATCALGDAADADHGEARSSGDLAHCVDTFGVRFIDPVDGYVLADRATKYGVLFIVLTFAAVAAVELARRVRVHPIQYLFVGFALALFFLLLVSLAEQVGFDRAYLAAATACSVLLGYYGAWILGGRLRGVAFGAAIGGLYGVLYALLELEQTALVLGSLLLFVVLAAAMVATRRLDWYALGRSLDEAPVAP